MEFQFEDIVFGIFPIVGGEMLFAFGLWPNNSVGDIIDMLMQMLEVSFILFFMSFPNFHLFIQRHLNLFTIWILPIVWVLHFVDLLA